MTAATSQAVGRIGPNAITRVAQVLPAVVGDRATGELFAAAGLSQYLRHPPEKMVLEGEVRRLHATLRERLEPRVAAEVARAAGEATGTYLLAHRIPRAAQVVLKRLPAWWAARVLLGAVSRHAWTFAGSGHFSAELPAPFAMRVVLRIRENPLCKNQRSEAPACGYYTAVFERLFRELVHPAARVDETACEACGAAACEFQIDWSPGQQ